jgi:hypothetical protein
MNNFSFITFDPTIEPNKQRLKLNNLASIQREKLKGAHAIQEPTIFTNLARSQMQTLTKTYNFISLSM